MGYVILLLWVLIMSLAAFALFGMDKRKAKRGGWRIPERTLFSAAILGGTPGAMLGMKVFHHKTKHWYFKVFFPVLLVMQVALLAAGLYWLYR